MYLCVCICMLHICFLFMRIIYSLLTWIQVIQNLFIRQGKRSFKIISSLLLGKLKKKSQKEKENGIFGFEIHSKIKDYNAHRFFKVYIINTTGKHITNQ